MRSQSAKGLRGDVECMRAGTPPLVELERRSRVSWRENHFLEVVLVVYQRHVSEGEHAAVPDCLCDQVTTGAECAPVWERRQIWSLDHRRQAGAIIFCRACSTWSRNPPRLCDQETWGVPAGMGHWGRNHWSSCLPCLCAQGTREAPLCGVGVEDDYVGRPKVLLHTSFL